MTPQAHVAALNALQLSIRMQANQLEGVLSTFMTLSTLRNAAHGSTGEALRDLIKATTGRIKKRAIYQAF